VIDGIPLYIKLPTCNYQKGANIERFISKPKITDTRMYKACVVLRDSTYEALESSPANNRGYICLLRGGFTHKGTLFDVDIGHVVSSFATGISQGDTNDVDEQFLRLLREDHGVRLVPYFKTDATVEKVLNYNEFEELHKRTSQLAANDDTKLYLFLLLGEDKGRFYERTFEPPIISYDDFPAVFVEGLEKSETQRIEAKIEELRRLGFKFSSSEQHVSVEPGQLEDVLVVCR